MLTAAINTDITGEGSGYCRCTAPGRLLLLMVGPLGGITYQTTILLPESYTASRIPKFTLR